jgi:hypothetical protein
MANSIDPNVYALSIDLSMNSAAATRQWNDFSTQAVALEKQITDAAKNSLTAVMGVVDVVSQSLKAVIKNSVDFKVNSQDVVSAYQDINKEMDHSSDMEEDYIKNQKKALDVMKEMHDYDLDASKSLKNDLKLSDTMLETFQQVVEAVKVKNKQHELQNNLLETDNNLADRFNDTMHDTGVRVRLLNHLWTRMSTAARAMWNNLKGVDGDTEKFVTTNYRAYGSQQDLVNSARDLSLEWGVTKEVALETIKVLTDLRLPQDEMQKYGETITRANRYLGAGVVTIGQYAARLKGLGQGSDYLERKTITLSETMRKFGLTAEDNEKLMRSTASNANNITIAFGGSVDAIERFEQAKSALMAVNKTMGESTDVANKFADALANDVLLRQKWSSLSGVMIQDAEDLQRALVKGGLALRRQGVDLEALQKSAAAGDVAAQQRLKVYADVFTNGDQAALLMMGQVGALADQMNLTGQSAEDLAKITQQLHKNAMDPFAESNTTLTAQLRILGSRLLTIYNIVAQLAANALYPFVVALNVVVGGITYLIGVWRDLLRWLDQFPIISQIIRLFEWMAGILVVVGIAAVGFAGAIVTLATSFFFLQNVAQRTAAMVQTIATTMVAVANAIGLSIAAVFRGIGQGLQALGNAIRSVMVPLLVLGIATAAAGVGAYFFAEAVLILAGVSWGGIAKGVITLGVAIAGLALILAIVGSVFTGPIGGGILLFSAAVFLLAGASVLAGYGLQLAGEGLMLMGDALSKTGAAGWSQLFLIAAGLTAVGFGALIAAPGILLLAGTMLIIEAASLALTGALSALTQIINTLDTDLLQIQAGKLLRAGLDMLAASGAMMMAGLAMAAAATTVTLSSVLLMAGAVVLGVVASALTISTAILTLAAGMLYAASALMLQSGQNLELAGIAISTAAVLYAESAGLIAVGSLALMASGGMIIVGAASITAGSIALGVAAVALGATGAGLLLGIIPFRFALRQIENIAPRLAAAGQDIEVGGQAMASGLIAVHAASGLLSETGTNINNGVADLNAAFAQMEPTVSSIDRSMGWLDSAADRFVNSAPRFEQMGRSLALIAASFAAFAMIDTQAMGNQADQMLIGIPKLTAAAEGLETASLKFKSAANNFSDPVTKLTSVLAQLNSQVRQFVDGIDLASSIGKMAVDMDKYAAIIEQSAEKIEIAIATRAIPAMRAAEQAGVQQAIMAETLNSVHVFTETEDAREAPDDTPRDILNTLVSIKEQLMAIASNMDQDFVGEMANLMGQIVGVRDTDSGLQSNLSNWRQH